MMNARNHHFISQCYLKGFTEGGTKDSQLFAVNLSDGSSFSTKPKNVGAERDFNRVEGRPPGELEAALSSFESTVNAALGRIRSLCRIDNLDDWNAVLNLIALFAVRNPRLRECERKFIDRTLRMMLSTTLATPERWESQVRRMKAAGTLQDESNVSYEQVKEFHEQGEYDIGISNARQIELEFGSHDSVLSTLVARKWQLCISDPGSGGFIASDHPVCLMGSDGTMPSFQHPIGYGTADSTVIFPLGCELLTVGTFQGVGGVVQLSPFQVAYMNGTVCAYARRQVYARDATFRVLIGKNREPLTGAELSRQLADRHRN
jgi:Protein of unknown function (DUF4238)